LDNVPENRFFYQCAACLKLMQRWTTKGSPSRRTRIGVAGLPA
jgi:hypothetical protein